MNRLKRELGQISRSSSIVLFGVVIAISGILSRGAPQSARAGVKFEVVSVRVLSSKEAADRSPDFVGPNVAVRLRLSSSGRGFYLYTAKDALYPIGYTLKLMDGKMIWPSEKRGEVGRPSSPGIEKATGGLPANWILLSGWIRPAVEWEVLDSTSSAGEKHAFTAFIRERDKEEPQEVISEAFVVPAGRSPAQ